MKCHYSYCCFGRLILTGLPKCSSIKYAESFHWLKYLYLEQTFAFIRESESIASRLFHISHGNVPFVLYLYKIKLKLHIVGNSVSHSLLFIFGIERENSICHPPSPPPLYQNTSSASGLLMRAKLVHFLVTVGRKTVQVAVPSYNDIH